MTWARWLAVVILSFEATRGLALEVAPEVTASEERRIETIERVSRSTIAVFERSGGNGGSGVIISPDGIALTNFHVTAPCGAEMVVGTSDGRTHTAVLLGIDPTGDIALIRLLGEETWPAAEIGDSDTVRVGDPAIVAGNPFLLAEDFSPSVSFGVISGTRRYQPPSGGVLEYADCLQTDAAINPGNSGGPLFDGRGRLIGINGRGSFEKRGRVNVGFGYAVSINQVMRFVPLLEAGLVADHASLGATVTTRRGPQAIVNAIETDSAAYRRGIRPGDEMVSLDGRDTPTANAFLNALGVLPEGWPVRVEYRRDGRTRACDVRLGPLHAAAELRGAIAGSTPRNVPKPNLSNTEYLPDDEFANGAAQQAAVDRILENLTTDRGAPPSAPQAQSDPNFGPVDLGGTRTYSDPKLGPVVLHLGKDSAEWISPSGEYRADLTRDLSSQAAPPAAPPLLGALWVWRTLLDNEIDRIDRVESLGRLPYRVGDRPGPVLAATHLGLRVEVYCDASTGLPRGIEAARDASEDRVRIDFGTAIRPTSFPERMTIFVGDRLYAELTAEPAGEATP